MKKRKAFKPVMLYKILKSGVTRWQKENLIEVGCVLAR